MSQFLRPNSDITVGSWTTAPLFSKIDEVVADDADYIQTLVGADLVKVGLSAPPDGIPLTQTNHIVRVRTFGMGGSVLPAHDGYSGHLVLLEGTTRIAGWEMTSDLTGFVTNEFPLGSGEIKSISDYSNLSLRFIAPVYLEESTSGIISWAEMEIPDATTPPDPPASGQVLYLQGGDQLQAILDSIEVKHGLASYTLQSSNSSPLIVRGQFINSLEQVIVPDANYYIPANGSPISLKVMYNYPFTGIVPTYPVTTDIASGATTVEDIPGGATCFIGSVTSGAGIGIGFNGGPRGQILSDSRLASQTVLNYQATTFRLGNSKNKECLRGVRVLNEFVTFAGSGKVSLFTSTSSFRRDAVVIANCGGSSNLYVRLGDGTLSSTNFHYRVKNTDAPLKIPVMYGIPIQILSDTEHIPVVAIEVTSVRDDYPSY